MTQHSASKQRDAKTFACIRKNLPVPEALLSLETKDWKRRSLRSADTSDSLREASAVKASQR